METLGRWRGKRNLFWREWWLVVRVSQGTSSLVIDVDRGGVGLLLGVVCRLRSEKTPIRSLLCFFFSFLFYCFKIHVARLGYYMFISSWKEFSYFLTLVCAESGDKRRRPKVPSMEVVMKDMDKHGIISKVVPNRNIGEWISINLTLNSWKKARWLWFFNVYFSLDQNKENFIWGPFTYSYMGICWWEPFAFCWVSGIY